MASIVLGTVGSALGGAAGGTLGAAIGSSIGRYVGSAVDGTVFGSGSLPSLEGPRVADLAVQTSTYGKMIPMLYGTMRLAGNIIWSRPIKEVATTTTTTSGGGGKGGGGGVTQNTTTYSYTVSLAIAICEGSIDSVLRIWADAKQLDLSLGTYRIYTGDEAQMPDAFIEGFEGVGFAPAYRGLAYIVVEDFPLAEYGNRIPNFTFEVNKKAQHYNNEEEILEEMIKSVILIPGAGEFVYDTKIQQKLSGEDVAGNWVQQGTRVPVNMHNPDGVANALLALDQMEEALPNLEWVGLVVTWFGTDLDAGQCNIVPGVEYQQGATTNPDLWGVAGYNRATARQITLVNNSPRYGGTPDDASVLRLVNAIKSKGWKVLFYPMFFMDVEDKPWRGRVTGSAADVQNFFVKSNGYNNFIIHYANLMNGEVDAFVIGSELIGLTKVTSATGVYPAVDALVSLAASVKGIMGAGTKITYAADWSEYHHTDGGWYNLDSLWASPNIDFVGIDAYFPLTDAPQQGYDVNAVIDGWTQGEDYDFYYADAERTNKQPLGAAYASKDIAWWWNNTHVNPNGQTTAWVPQSKPIWFTEYGFPSVDGATNQPNVFYDPDSSEGFFPRFSRGRVDFRAQRTGLKATELQWKDSLMIERMFVWTWDARPFPYWPDLLSVWADGGQWKTGHWINGKLGISALAAIVADLCRQVGLDDSEFDVTRLTDLVEGYVVAAPNNARRLIEQLMAAYFFDAVESDGLIKFVPRGGGIAANLDKQDLIAMEGENNAQDLVLVRRQQELELPRQVNVLYVNRSSNYLQGNQFSQRQVTKSREIKTVSLPLVLSDQGAKVLADQWLYHSWISRTQYECNVPMKYGLLEPTDIVEINVDGAFHRMRIVDVLQTKPGLLRLRGVAEDIASYDVYLPPANAQSRTQVVVPLGNTQMEILDLPILPFDDPNQSLLHFALTGLDAGWRGAVVYRSDDGGGSYGQVAISDSPAIVGTALTVLPDGKHTVLDEISSVDVVLLGSEGLENATFAAVLNGANLALIGEELVQFTNAEMLATGKYRLTGLLRGRLGTEYAIASHMVGERFVLLNGRIEKVVASHSGIGLSRLYKPVTIGATLGNTNTVDYAYGGNGWRPYSPVHLSAARSSSNTISIMWVRRDRAGGGWRDYVDIPMNEAFERYEVDVLDEENNVVRTLFVNSNEVEYTESMQIADFGAAQPAVKLRVYQMSQVVGRGYAAEAVV
ncbi:MAG: glycoside hydrolase TIM-barrel-like domain-containing protein [Alphaproteobacteria bacterium]|nr:glycoside hydrolase TIM-barrel-like domain-containing protein [Alphaproteobacteria bacterium]